MSSAKTKTCTSCSTEKPATLEFFNKHSRGLLGLHSQCKCCRKIQRKAWYDKNKEYNKDYYLKNRDEVRAVQQSYRNKNKTTKKLYDKNRRDITRTQTMERYYSDPVFRLSMIFRRRFSHFLRDNVTSSIEKYVGCSYDELITHIESLWSEGMGWDNYGNPNGDHTECWHIDHKRPISSFDFVDDLEKSLHECWNYSNLQPLWAKDNLTKSSKVL